MTSVAAIEAAVAEPAEGQSAELVARARAGDRAALEALIVSVERRVYALAWRLVGDRAAAEDVAQEVFLKICRRLDRFRGGNFLGWVYRMVVNQAHDWRRRAGPAAEELGEVGAPPGFDAAREEQLRRVTDAMRVLSPKEREALVMTDMEGFTSGEAARILGCMAITVRVRAAQARKKLRRVLARHYPELREGV